MRFSPSAVWLVVGLLLLPLMLLPLLLQIGLHTMRETHTNLYSHHCCFRTACTTYGKCTFVQSLTAATAATGGRALHDEEALVTFVMMT